MRIMRNSSSKTLIYAKKFLYVLLCFFVTSHHIMSTITMVKAIIITLLVVAIPPPPVPYNIHYKIIHILETSHQDTQHYISCGQRQQGAQTSSEYIE